MPQDLDALTAGLYPPTPDGGLDAPALATATAEAALVQTPPADRSDRLDRRIDSFALRRLLRRKLDAPAVLRCLGVSLCMIAWMLLLLGLAHFVVAALHNRNGELGLGLDATLLGGEVCLLSFALATAGVPLWVRAERRLRLKTGLAVYREATSEEATEGV
jgi:hypothetical protein